MLRGRLLGGHEPPSCRRSAQRTPSRAQGEASLGAAIKTRLLLWEIEKEIKPTPVKCLGLFFSLCSQVVSPHSPQICPSASPLHIDPGLVPRT